MSFNRRTQVNIVVENLYSFKNLYVVILLQFFKLKIVSLTKGNKNHEEAYVLMKF